MIDKYICSECHASFDDPKVYYEKHGLDSPPYEKFQCCPYCGGAYTEFKDNMVTEHD